MHVIVWYNLQPHCSNGEKKSFSKLWSWTPLFTWPVSWPCLDTPCALGWVEVGVVLSGHSLLVISLVYCLMGAAVWKRLLLFTSTKLIARHHILVKNNTTLITLTITSILLWQVIKLMPIYLQDTNKDHSFSAYKFLSEQDGSYGEIDSVCTVALHQVCDYSPCLENKTTKMYEIK